MQFTIKGRPYTKKNSSRIVYAKGKPKLLPSKQYEEYRQAAGWQIPCKHIKIDKPINLKCVYYMPTRHRVDLVNLLEATCDILVDYGVLADDNSNIVAGHDGSCVRYSKENPRVEITITRIDE